MKRETLMLAAAALVVGAAGAAGLTSTILNRQHRASLVEHGNRVADTFVLRYDSLSNSYEERGHTVTSQATIIDRMEGTNATLSARLADTEATVLTLTETNARLSVTGSVEGEGVPTGGTYAPTVGTVPVGEGVVLRPRTTLSYERSRVVLFGEIELAPDLSFTGNLSVEADLWLGTAVSRLPSGELRVDAWSDVPTLRFTQVDVINNLSDPLAPKGGGFFLFKPGTWIGVGLGVAATILIGGAL